MRKPVVGIDFGHGGTDSGAIGGGMKESKINRNVGLKLQEFLLKRGYVVVLSQPTDVKRGLSERSKIFNAAKCDVVIFIHHNASASHEGDGFDIIFQMDAKYTKASKKLADLVAAEFSLLNNKHKVFSKAGTKNKLDDFYTALAVCNCPAVITELAFIDNPKDVVVVDTLLEQYREAEAIADAIDKYFGRF